MARARGWEATPHTASASRAGWAGALMSGDGRGVPGGVEGWGGGYAQLGATLEEAREAMELLKRELSDALHRNELLAAAVPRPPEPPPPARF